MRFRLLIRLVLGASILPACAPKTGDSGPVDTGARPDSDSSPVDTADTGPDSADTGDGDPPNNPEIPTADCTETGVGNDEDAMVHIYDTAGQRTSTVYANASSPGANYSEAWSWSDGHVTLDSYDDGGDGVIDTIDAYAYDQDDLVVWSHDGDGDGSTTGLADSVYTLLYDAPYAGSLTEMDRDDANDGTVDAVYLYTYDADGNLDGMTLDEGVDGTVDTRVIQSTTVSDEGETITQTTTDEGDDGVPDLVDLTITDSQGRPTYEEQDADGNGDLDWTYTWLYGDEGELVSVTLVAWSMTGDEDYDVVTSYEYDGWGRESKWTIDASYTNKYVWLWAWDC